MEHLATPQGENFLYAWTAPQLQDMSLRTASWDPRVPARTTWPVRSTSGPFTGVATLGDHIPRRPRLRDEDDKRPGGLWRLRETQGTLHELLQGGQRQVTRTWCHTATVSLRPLTCASPRPSPVCPQWAPPHHSLAAGGTCCPQVLHTLGLRQAGPKGHVVPLGRRLGTLAWGLSRSRNWVGTSRGSLAAIKTKETPGAWSWVGTAGGSALALVHPAKWAGPAKQPSGQAMQHGPCAKSSGGSWGQRQAVWVPPAFRAWG